MAHQGLFSPESVSEVPISQSPWPRREDLQGMMGSPGLTPIDPFLDSPKSGAASSNFSHPLYPTPNLGSRRPAVTFRSLIPSPQSWPDHNGGSRPSSFFKPGPEPPSDLRVNAEQDFWSGLPPLRPKRQVPQPITPISDKPSPVSTVPSQDTFHISTPELETRVNGFPPSDSGYGTRSVVSNKSAMISFPMELEGRFRRFSPNTYSRPTGSPSFSSLPPLLPVDTIPQHHETHPPYPGVPGPDYPDQQTCDIAGCSWIGKCPSDKKKHMLRHERPFLCDVPDCKRKTGFGTLNDLERHKICVHGVESGRGSPKRFKCFAENCSRAEQIWPRYDNFRQHLRRMHGELSVKELIAKSEEWYESKGKAPQESPAHQRQPPRDNLRFSDVISLADGTSCIGGPGASEADLKTVQPATLYNDSNSVSFPGTGKLNLSRPHTFGSMDGSSLISVDLAPSIISTEEQDNSQRVWECLNRKKRPLSTGRRPSAKKRGSGSPLFRDIHLDHLELPSAESVKESAMGLLKALEKETKNADSWKDSDVRHTLAPENVPSFLDLLRVSGQEEKIILQELIRAGLEKLGNQQTTDSSRERSSRGNSDEHSGQELTEKRFVCSYEGCNKRTRRQCEMRKHEIRHQRPYGCTFTNCTKKFGSKNDWKRHENTRHFHHQSWLCQEHVPQKNSIEKKECGEVFSRRNMFVDHLRKKHNVDQSDVGELLKRNRIGPNSQVRFWCGFCGCSRDIKSQGLKAIDERFDHIDEHLKEGADMARWIRPTNANVLKGKDQNSGRTSRDTNRSYGDETTAQDGPNQRSKALQPSFGLYPIPAHVTQNTSYERGRRPAKHPRIESSHGVLSTAQGNSPCPEPEKSVSMAGLAEQEPTIWEPGKHTNKQIAESLIYICEPPPARKVVSITCCRCQPNSNNNFLPSRYNLDIQLYCAVCRHKPCHQCTRHHEVEPTSEELRDTNKPLLPGAPI